MASFEFLAIILTGLGLSASILYYASVLKNSEKARRKDIIFQSHTPRSPEYFELFMKVIQMHDYTSRKEYEEKYTEEQRVQANYLFSHFNVIGVLFLDNIATGDEIFQIYPPHAVILLWEALEPMIQYLRVDVSNADFLKPFEALYHEARRRTPNYVPIWKRIPQ